MLNKAIIVSIIVPCYNQAQYLAETLQSVIDQRYIDWECIIVNDGSPDDTENIALKWIEKDSRFKYVSKKNGGLSDARNYGIKHSKGKFILPLDSDDKISPDYIFDAIAVFDKDPTVKLVFCKAELFGVDTGEWDLLPYTYDNMLFVRNCIYCTALYKREDYDQTAGYNSNMIFGWEDYDFWLSLLRREDKVVKLDKTHFYYRTKDVSMRALINQDKEKYLRLQLFKNHQDIYLEYMNPIEIYNELKRYRLIDSSLQYKIGKIIISPLRCFLKLIKRK